MRRSLDIVIPTIGRPQLATLLDSLDRTIRPDPRATLPMVYLVDDRPAAGLPVTDRELAAGLRILHTGGRGPAAARNAGWRAGSADWVVFLDDDVEVTADWWPALLADLGGQPDRVAGVQGRITVPLPPARRPNDFERNTAALRDARWITADMAYRRSALQAVDGFDERFRRAFREDSDIALRILDAGYELAQGNRHTLHPVRPADRWISVRQQRGNSDDVLMHRLHGRDWRQRAEAPVGRLPGHLLTTAAALTALAAIAGRRRTLARLAALAWLANWIEFSWRRIAPGPRNPAEVLTMAVTSAVIPVSACWHRLAGMLRHRAVRRCGLPAAVLLDRDGTIVHDVPYNGDPAAVRPVPGARRALRRLRRAGIRVAVVSNQSGIGRGMLTDAQVAAVNSRIEQLLGPFDGWFVCPHTAQDGCSCRKPAPGLVLAAARSLGVRPERCLVIGDIGADVAAAAGAGARAILVPTPATRPEEVAAADRLAPDLPAAVRWILTGAGASR
ncbi:MAG: HAD-IIIA family hydrolase [Jatrophihabitantaceae bacterium]